MRLQAGDKAPNFLAPSTNGGQISLGDFAGKILILYFYPKDMTKGCSIEANDFSALCGDFVALGASIIGVSPDSVASHQKFIARECLKIALLSDENHEIAAAYGAYGKKINYGREYMGIIRSTFIIQDSTIVAAFYNVKATNHAQKVLESLKKLLNCADSAGDSNGDSAESSGESVNPKPKKSKK